VIVSRHNISVIFKLVTSIFTLSHIKYDARVRVQVISVISLICCIFDGISHW